MRHLPLFSLAAILAAYPALAQGVDDDFHDDDDTIVVTAPYVNELDILAGTSVLVGDELTRDLRPQIGDSLTRLPGVSATSFTPGASRPVLRGFQGPRVRVLTDGIGSLDASNTSVDHAVTIDPLTAVRVEVLRGPAVLLFGGDAIGGAVNVIDKRIPRAVPDEPVHVDLLAGYGTAADDVSVAGSLDFPVGDRLVFHLDGSFRDTEDVRVPNFVISRPLRNELLAEAAEDAVDEPEEAAELIEATNQRDRVFNTATQTTTAGAGLAFIDEGGEIGFSVGYYDTDYGIPERPGGGHHHGEEEGEEEEGKEEEEGPVTIALEQIRADLRASVNMGGFFEKLSVRAGYSDYEHIEFEGDEVGTVFDVQGIEARAELTQAEREGWRGVLGIQFRTRDFVAIGEEAFVPPNQLDSFALFAVQEVDFGRFEVEGSARYDTTDISSRTTGFDRGFDAFSAAIGASYAFYDEGIANEGLRVGVNLSRAERAPSPEELLSNGPHIATQAFEIGNPAFDTEKSLGAELYARWDSDDLELRAAVYGNAFDDYIFEAETADEMDELPVFRYFQRDATYFGFEVFASARLAQLGAFAVRGDVVADYVRASVDSDDALDGPLPRIPPLRVLTGLEATSPLFGLRAEVEWVDDQSRVTQFENPTDDFTLVNLSASYRPFGPDGNITLLASANNILDATARRHASFTKDYVPLAGRDFRVSAKLSF